LGVSFPGIIAHELGHMIFCWFSGVRIHKYVLFQPASPLGYVLHSNPRTVLQEFLIVMGPLFFNSFVALGFFKLTHYLMPPYSWIMLWLGFSLSFNSFPSIPDGKALYVKSKNSVKKGRIYNIIYMPFVYLIYRSQSKPHLRGFLYSIILLGLTVAVF